MAKCTVINEFNRVLQEERMKNVFCHIMYAHRSVQLGMEEFEHLDFVINEIYNEDVCTNELYSEEQYDAILTYIDMYPAWAFRHLLKLRKENAIYRFPYAEKMDLKLYD